MSATRRSQKIVDREVQYSLLKKVIIHWMLLLIAHAGVMLFWIFFIDNPLGTTQENFRLFIRYYMPVLVVSLAIMPVFVLDTAKLSHRFTGPVMRLRRSLNDLASGRAVQPMKFRDNDFWRAMADDFNSAFMATNTIAPTGTAVASGNTSSDEPTKNDPS